MADEQIVEVEGKIVSVLPGTMFRAQLSNGHVVLAQISGKLRKHFIKIGVGDCVKMEMSTNDISKARIVYRLRGNEQRRPQVTAPSSDTATATQHRPVVARPAATRPAGNNNFKKRR